MRISIATPCAVVLFSGCCSQESSVIPEDLVGALWTEKPLSCWHCITQPFQITHNVSSIIDSAPLKKKMATVSLKSDVPNPFFKCEWTGLVILKFIPLIFRKKDVQEIKGAFLASQVILIH